MKKGWHERGAGMVDKREGGKESSRRIASEDGLEESVNWMWRVDERWSGSGKAN